jgi:hypothetical protein
MLDKALQLIAYLLFIGMVITMGWEEPLSHRFLPRQLQPQQDNEQGNTGARVEPQVKSRSGLLRSSLDYGPYRVRNGVVEFDNRYDPKTLGNPTTTQNRHQIPPQPIDAPSRPAQ